MRDFFLSRFDAAPRPSAVLRATLPWHLNGQVDAGAVLAFFRDIRGPIAQLFSQYPESNSGLHSLYNYPGWQADPLGGSFHDTTQKKEEILAKAEQEQHRLRHYTDGPTARQRRIFDGFLSMILRRFDYELRTPTVRHDTSSGFPHRMSGAAAKFYAYAMMERRPDIFSALREERWGEFVRLADPVGLIPVYAFGGRTRVIKTKVAKDGKGFDEIKGKAVAVPMSIDERGDVIFKWIVPDHTIPTQPDFVKEGFRAVQPLPAVNQIHSGPAATWRRAYKSFKAFDFKVFSELLPFLGQWAIADVNSSEAVTPKWMDLAAVEFRRRHLGSAWAAMRLMDSAAPSIVHMREGGRSRAVLTRDPVLALEDPSFRVTSGEHETAFGSEQKSGPSVFESLDELWDFCFGERWWRDDALLALVLEAFFDWLLPFGAAFGGDNAFAFLMREDAARSRWEAFRRHAGPMAGVTVPPWDAVLPILRRWVKMFVQKQNIPFGSDDRYLGYSITTLATSVASDGETEARSVEFLRDLTTFIGQRVFREHDIRLADFPAAGFYAALEAVITTPGGPELMDILDRASVVRFGTAYSVEWRKVHMDEPKPGGLVDPRFAFGLGPIYYKLDFNDLPRELRTLHFTAVPPRYMKRVADHFNLNYVDDAPDVRHLDDIITGDLVAYILQAYEATLRGGRIPPEWTD